VACRKRVETSLDAARTSACATKATYHKATYD